MRAEGGFIEIRHPSHTTRNTTALETGRVPCPCKRVEATVQESESSAGPAGNRPVIEVISQSSAQPGIVVGLLCNSSSRSSSQRLHPFTYCSIIRSSFVEVICSDSQRNEFGSPEICKRPLTWVAVRFPRDEGGRINSKISSHLISSRLFPSK